MAEVAYIRVSTVDQSTDRQFTGQRDQFDMIFEEKISGKDVNRPQLQACLEYCRKGDVLKVWSIDRMARNLFDLQSLVKDFNEKGVAVHFIKEGLNFSDEQSPMERLQFQIMGAFAEFERSIIRERQREGIALAKGKGIYKGRKPLNDELKEQIYKLLDSDMKKQDIADIVGVGIATVYNYNRQRKHEAIT